MHLLGQELQGFRQMMGKEQNDDHADEQGSTKGDEENIEHPIRTVIVVLHVGAG